MKSRLVFPLIPSLFTFVMVLSLLSLGAWQISRMNWKSDLLHKVQENISLPPVSIQNVLNDMRPHNWEFRKVKLKGKFLHNLEVNLIPKALNGQPGYHLITPFQLEDGSIVIINRGWVPLTESYETIDRPDEIIEIMGTINGFQRKGLFVPKNNFDKKEVFYLDAKDFVEYTNLITILPFYVVQEPVVNEIKHFPQEVGVSLNIPNNHLVYAITWFTLALAAFIIYAIFVFQWNQRLQTLNESYDS